MTGSDKRLVFYADDDRDDLGFLADALAPYTEIDLQTFPDGGAILTHLEKLQATDRFPCLVILDINMPVVNGKEVLFRMRERKLLKPLAVVLFTTSSLAVDEAFAKAYDADFITKPLHLDQMDAIVDKVLSICSRDVRQG